MRGPPGPAVGSHQTPPEPPPHAHKDDIPATMSHLIRQLFHMGSILQKLETGFIPN